MSDFRGHGSWQQNNFWHTNQPQNQVDYGNNFKAQNFYDGNLGVQNFYNNQPSSSNRQVWLNEQQHLQPGNNLASHSNGYLQQQQQFMFKQPPLLPQPRQTWTVSQVDYPDHRHNNGVPPPLLRPNFNHDSKSSSLKINVTDGKPHYVYAPQQSGNALREQVAAKPVTTKWYRRKGSERTRPGLRSFCNYVNEPRPTHALGGVGNGQRLQYKYQIKASMWHRGWWGLHKKKTQLEAKQARYRALKAESFSLRKSHCNYWTRNASKPTIKTTAINPWPLDDESDKYLRCVEDFLPSSWQTPDHAYFQHPEYQLFKLETNGLEFNSLDAYFDNCGLKITQVVRMQNVSMFGCYQNRKQQLVAEGVALTEVVRFVGVRRRHLRALCTRGLDARRLDNHVTCYASASHALASLDAVKGEEQGYLVVGRAVAARRPRQPQEFYPEYIVVCKVAHM